MPKQGAIIGKSKGLAAVLESAAHFAPHNVVVLITGETGTGKELIAHYIHDNSLRRAERFVACNLAALPENLLESALFGHVKGAFTGSSADRRGLLEEAGGGTLFLDEIGDLPMGLQVRLLRLVENHEYYRVGESTTRTADVRIVFATHRDLERASSFRPDLYYRISGARIMLPPLRQRRDDILLLADSFIASFCDTKKEIDEVVRVALWGYPWPGNVRELKNTIESAVMLSGNHDVITMADVPYDIQQYTGSKAELNKRDDMYKELIENTLRSTRGNKARAAEIIGISTRTLYRKLEKFGIGN